MDFTEYQEKAISTAVYNKKYAIVYPALGIAGEAGEVAEKVKKLLRDRDGVVGAEFLSLVTKEMGDVLWYLANLANDLGISLDMIAVQNIEKLQDRKERGTIHGSGDSR